MKPKQPELSKVEILMLAALGEICSKLEDILKGSRRKFELNACEFISKDVNLLWRAPESYNQCYVKFGYENRDDLKTYVSQFCERLEINDAWESLEDIEAYWNDFILTVSKKLNLNENHEDNFIKYYFNNTKQLYNLNTNEMVSYESVFSRLSLAVLFPSYIPGFILNNFLKELDKIKKELYVFGIDINVILFGKNKDSKIWLKQYKVNCENIFVDSSDEILKARRNLNNVFSIQSMETIGLSCRTKTHFLLPENVDWQKYLFPGGLALVSCDGTVHYEHLSGYIGDFPKSEELVEKIMFAFGELNELTKEESVKYLKDGMKFYIAPKFDRFQYEKHSGFYYDPETTLYYEARSGYFFDGERAVYLYWCEESKCYLPVPTATAPAVATSNTEERQLLAIESCSTSESLPHPGTSSSLSNYLEPDYSAEPENPIETKPESTTTESVTNQNQSSPLLSSRKRNSDQETDVLEQEKIENEEPVLKKIKE